MFQDPTIPHGLIASKNGHIFLVSKVVMEHYLPSWCIKNQVYSVWWLRIHVPNVTLAFGKQSSLSADAFLCVTTISCGEEQINRYEWGRYFKDARVAPLPTMFYSNAFIQS